MSIVLQKGEEILSLISQQQIDEIIEKNDIGDVIGEYVKLERKGSGYSGLCPFHNEKTPSFSVHEGKQIFKCFGCGKGGNVVNFIMLAENLSYVEALGFLADRAGIVLDKSVSKEQEEKQRIKNDIYAVNKIAARFFYETLKKSPRAQKYLYDRGIRAETVKQFGLGYAPESFDALYKHFADNAIAPNPKLLEKAGLITANKDNRGYYDKFRNRVIFPIFDVQGNVIAFGGRVMDDSMPKYLNSPETPAYSKGNNLYALNIAKKSQSERVIIVEGYMDCIALHKAGINWAVASLGTALTQAQARLLKKYFNEVIIGYDADGAGQKATLRGLDILAGVGFRVRVLSLAEVDASVKDPDEFLRKHSVDDFYKAIELSKSLVEYKISKIAEKYPVTQLESKAMFLKYSTKVLASITGEAEKELYADWFAKKYNISKNALLSEIERLQSRGFSEDADSRTRKIIKGVKLANKDKAQSEEEQMQIKQKTPEEIKLDKHIKRLILLMSEDKKAKEKYYCKVKEINDSEVNGKLLEKLSARYEQNLKTGVETVLADMTDSTEEEVRMLTDMISKWIRPPDYIQACEEILNQCIIIDCERRLACINEMINDTNLSREERSALVREAAAIIKERMKYKNGN